MTNPAAGFLKKSPKLQNSAASDLFRRRDRCRWLVGDGAPDQGFFRQV